MQGEKVVKSARVLVIGSPAPQGSKRPVGRDRQGRAIMIESSKAVAPWRQDVATVAAAVAAAARRAAAGERPQAVVDADRTPLFYSPVAIRYEFILQTPKWALKQFVKTGIMPHHATRPDASKLERSTEDAMVTAGLLRDDSLVVDVRRLKRYALPGEATGALIEIRLMPEPIERGGAA